MAREQRCTMDECVFVGEGFNDSDVIKKAGFSIAYPPRVFESAAAADLQIEQDDLMQVVEAVIR